MKIEINKIQFEEVQKILNMSLNRYNKMNLEKDTILNHVTYEKLKNMIKLTKINEFYVVEASENNLDDFRNICSAYLLTGSFFDENYKVTKEGLIIESLMDALYF
jgi:hypothetical protein